MTATTETIDRRSSTPYYQQLFDALERRLARGEIVVGQRLPSENELCTAFGLSRATVRQALQLLESRGLVHRIAGRGIFAAEPPSRQGWMIQGTEGFLESAVGHQNRAVSTRVIRHGPRELPDDACRSLELPDGTHGFELVRLRSLDGTAALYSVNYSPPALVRILTGATEVLEGTASLTELLARSGYPLGGAHRSVRAVSPPPEVANALQVHPGTPVLHVRSSSWTPTGERFDVYDTWVHSDVVPLEIDVSAVDRLGG